MAQVRPRSAERWANQMTPSPEPPAREARPTVVGAASDAAAFLDAPGVDPGVLFDTVDRVLANMPDGAILTVYTDDSAARAEAAEWCAGRDVELLAVLSHEHHSTTLALRRGDQPREARPPAAPGRERFSPMEPARHPRPPPKP